MVDKKTHPGRRNFLLQAGLAGVASLAPAEHSAASATGAAAAASGAAAVGATAANATADTYHSLGPNEAAFIEALVNVMCPADELSPSGVDCGLAIYIDRQLAGPYGKGDGRYQRGPFRQGKPQLGLQLPLTPEQFCKAGIAAVDAACVRDRGAPFAALKQAEADAVLVDIADGRVTDERLSLTSWFNEIVYPLFVEACFADPMYGGNRNAVFWKMIGYPGLPANHAIDMVRYRGKPYPGAGSPKSIGDFS
jgi:gluconate 2-dehydrogenase gamma chain